MKTDYKILWIDDDHHYLRGDRRNIESFLDNYGIRLQIIQITVTNDQCPTQEESFSNAVADIDLDMVFVDFNMPEQGDKIIKHIRQDLHHYHLPILFYTSDTDAQATLQRSILALNGEEDSALAISDGIYFCDRDHITDKSKMILTSLLKKEARPQQGRGLLMDRVSEIDARMIESINSLWLRVPAEKRPAVQKELQDRLDNKLKQACNIRKELRGMSYDGIGQYLTDNSTKIDTFARAKILREMLRAIPDFNTNGDVLSDFCNGTNNLNALRNSYAHKTSNQISTDHNDERCKYIRTETRRHLENLDLILADEAE